MIHWQNSLNPSACVRKDERSCGAGPFGLPPAFEPAFFVLSRHAGPKPGGRPEGLTPLLCGTRNSPALAIAPVA